MKKLVITITVILFGINVYSQNCITCNNNTISNNGSALGSNNEATGANSIALGENNQSTGVNSFSAGYQSLAIGDGSIALGIFNKALSTYTLTLGANLKAQSTGAMVIGTGYNYNAPLMNYTAMSLAIGFHSDIPTIFVGPASGVGTVGKVGIGTITPSQLLDVNGTLNVVDDAIFGNDVSVNGVLGVNSAATFSNDVSVNGVLEVNSAATFSNDVGISGSTTIDGKTSTKELQVSEGDVFIEDIEKGIIMKSPDGRCWRGRLNNDAQLQFAEVDCNSFTAAKEHTNAEGIKVFPNPSQGMLNIELSEKQQGSIIKIINMQGSTVFSQKISGQRLQISTESIPAGNYILNIYNAKAEKIYSENIVFI